MNLINKREIRTLNKAREVLDTIASRTEHTWSGGMTHSAVVRAENGIFSALNALNSYGDQDLSYEELHNKPKPEDVV